MLQVIFELHVFVNTAELGSADGRGNQLLEQFRTPLRMRLEMCAELQYVLMVRAKLTQEPMLSGRCSTLIHLSSSAAVGTFDLDSWDEDAMSHVRPGLSPSTCRGQAQFLTHSNPIILYLFPKLSAWIKALNKRLPREILVHGAAEAPLSFHARKSAVWRRYRYTILTSNQNSVFLSPFVWHYYQKPLDVSRMNAAAQTLKCREPKDFSAFRKAGSSATHSDIVIHDIFVHQGATDPNLVEIEVCASWFVYGMMRLLTAALVDVGSGSLSIEQFYTIFDSGQRRRIKSSAPARGLCLLEVGYPAHQDPFISSSGQSSNGSCVTLGLSPYVARRWVV